MLDFHAIRWSMKALIVPKVTVKLSTNSANNNPIPSSAVAIVVSKNFIRTLILANHLSPWYYYMDHI